jgi:cold shock CspA family protein
MSAFESTTGTVSSFDEYKGYGTVKDAHGSELPFHCTAIAGGSRTIDVGQKVEFTVVPGRGGRWEAKDLRPV